MVYTCGDSHLGDGLGGALVLDGGGTRVGLEGPAAGGARLGVFSAGRDAPPSLLLPWRPELEWQAHAKGWSMFNRTLFKELILCTKRTKQWYANIGNAEMK